MPQVNATYTLECDLTGDLGYGDANEDLSAYWKRIDIDYGMSKPGDHMGRSATLRVVLNNASHKFSPEHASGLSGFATGRKLRLQMTYSATTKTLYEGRITNIQPTPGANGSRECVVRCDGYLKRLQEDEIAIDVQSNARTDELVALALMNAPERPGMATGWLLGVDGWSNLNSSTTLSAGASDFADLDTCANTYLFAGDNFDRQLSVYSALRDLTENERGWLFEDRDGRIVLWSRHHLAKDAPNAVDATLTDTDYMPLKYGYGERLVNEVKLTYHPRTIDGIGVPLGYTTEAIKIRGPGSVVVTIPFTKPESGARVGGTNLITPVTGFDYTANSNEFGSGYIKTKHVKVKSVRGLGDRAEITFYNDDIVPVYLLKGARIRGTRLLDFGSQQVTYEDTASVLANHTRRGRTLDLKMIEHTHVAEDIARWEVAHYGSPFGQLEQIEFYANKSAALMAQARDREVGDRLQLSETQTGANGEYFIIGKHIELSPQNLHRELWTLEPRPALDFMLLGTAGFGELNTGTRLGA